MVTEGGEFIVLTLYVTAGNVAQNHRPFGEMPLGHTALDGYWAIAQ